MVLIYSYYKKYSSLRFFISPSNLLMLLALIFLLLLEMFLSHSNYENKSIGATLFTCSHLLSHSDTRHSCHQNP